MFLFGWPHGSGSSPMWGASMLDQSVHIKSSSIDLELTYTSWFINGWKRCVIHLDQTKMDQSWITRKRILETPTKWVSRESSRFICDQMSGAQLILVVDQESWYGHITKMSMDPLSALFHSDREWTTSYYATSAENTAFWIFKLMGSMFSADVVDREWSTHRETKPTEDPNSTKIPCIWEICPIESEIPIAMAQNLLKPITDFADWNWRLLRPMAPIEIYIYQGGET